MRYPFTWPRPQAFFLHKRPRRRRAGWGPGRRLSPEALPILPLCSRCAPRPPRRVPRHRGAGAPRSQAGPSSPRRHTHRPPPSASPSVLPTWKPLGPALACGAPTPVPSRGSNPCSARAPRAASRAPETRIRRSASADCSARAVAPATPPLLPPPHPRRLDLGFRALT